MYIFTQLLLIFNFIKVFLSFYINFQTLKQTLIISTNYLKHFYFIFFNFCSSFTFYEDKKVHNSKLTLNLRYFLQAFNGNASKINALKPAVKRHKLDTNAAFFLKRLQNEQLKLNSEPELTLFCMLFLLFTLYSKPSVIYILFC